jgi:hypothetical protein
MARVIGNIPNFVNGISQQPKPIRDASQLEDQLNCYSTVSRGLMPRPGTEHLAKILSGGASNSWVHFINRDTDERYVAVYDETASNTSPQLLSSAEMNFLSGWTAFGSGTKSAVSDAEFLRSASPDAKSPYYYVDSNGVADSGVYLYPAFQHEADTTYTFSVWMTPPVAVTNLRIILQGSDLVAGNTTNIGAPAFGWQRYEVSATTKSTIAGSGGTNHFELKIICDTGRIDCFCPMVSVGSSAPTQSVWGDLAAPRMKVFDLEGTELQVWAPDGEGYLEEALDPSMDLKAVTVADYTFLANKKVTVDEGSSTSPSQDYEALIVVETVQPGSTIKVVVNGSTYAAITIDDTDPTDLGTGYTAERIAGDLNNAGTHAGDLGAIFDNVDHLGGAGNVVYLKDGSDFTVAVQGDSGEDGIRVIKKQVQTFGELPRIAEQGMLMEVKGNADNDWSAFWVKYDGNNGTDGVFTWSETVGPGETVDFDDTTMPHVMVRTVAGHFSLYQGLWADMAVGTSETNAQPSFVGETINDIFFVEGRLGVLAGENLIMSQVSGGDQSIFNFWRTSVTSLLDGDPIDVSSTYSKVSILRHAVPYQEQLLLFSDQTQFRLTKGDILSPKTVGIEPITDFESSNAAKPATVGNFVFFIVEKSDYASVREYYVARDTETNDARDISGHVPEYIPSGVTALKGTSNEDLILLHSSSDPDALFVYKFFWSGDQKVQGAWSQWQFPDTTKILGYEFLGSALYLVLKRADGVFLEKMELDVGAQDGSGLGYDLCMDRKVLSSDSGVSAVYDAGDDETTFTFTAHTWKSVPVIVGCSGNSNDYPPGYEVPIVGSPSSYDANTIVVAGDATSDTLMFGVVVQHYFTLSEFHVKARGSGNTSIPVSEGRLQVQRVRFNFTDAGHFKVLVDQEGRDTQKVYEYTGRNMSANENVVNAVAINSAEFSVPVMSLNTRCTVRVFSESPLPFRFLSADWMGNFHVKGKRI